MNIKTVGSVCSGIEAASVAWKTFDIEFKWFSEIGHFQSRVLSTKYPETKNLGNMSEIPDKLESKSIFAPDLICGGTPCQAFSLAGLKNGLIDDRGNLTLKFVDIINANDKIRESQNKDQSVIFWENVEGVLTDKTNAFGCFIGSLAGFESAIRVDKWSNAGIIYGPKRNVAWRVLDAKYFGLPQQRRRLYLLGGGKNFFPENILFEYHTKPLQQYPSQSLSFDKNGHHFEIFREYTDCLYSSYGTKWNGNAAAYNGSLFIVQNGRIRRFSPIECERLMGFPDNYTNLCGSKKTNRYQAIGNSWAVPVVKWIGERILSYVNDELRLQTKRKLLSKIIAEYSPKHYCYGFSDGLVSIDADKMLNCSPIPEKPVFEHLCNIVSLDAPEDIYISPVGCFGIVRRKDERNLKINPHLEKVLLETSSKMSLEEIETKSRVQKRGRFSLV